MIDIQNSKAYQYAKWCLEPDNQCVGRYIKKQAESWLEIADGKNEDAYIDIKTFKVISNLLKLMMHPDLHISIYNGMEDYAWFLIVAVFCTKSKADNSRFYHTALLEICRRNYKTFNSAIIFIIAMLTEPKFSRFFSVAPDYALSTELKKAVEKIIAVSPALNKRFKLNRDFIKCKLTDTVYTPLARSRNSMDGRTANMFLADEVGALDKYPIEAMRSSQITLENRLGIIISTQYPNDDNALIEEIDMAKKSLNKLDLSDKRIFALLYEPNEEFLSDEQWMTEDLIIYQSNPVACTNNRVFNNIKEKRAIAIQYENARENYLCKHNNIKYKGLGVEGFVDINKVRECRTTKDMSWWKGKKVFIGMDLSLTDDNTAIAMVTEYDGIIYTQTFGFIPQGRIELKSKKENVDYKKLIRDGACFACGDEVIDYSFVEDFILNLEDKYGVEIIQIGYDRYNALSSVQKLESAEYECVEIKQHSSVLHPATKLLMESILSKKFRYFSNQMLEINFQNARCVRDNNLNLYVNKKKSNGKVDMVVGLINAIYLQYQDELSRNENTMSWGIIT